MKIAKDLKDFKQEINLVSLTDAQKLLLEQCKVSDEHQKLLQDWLTGVEGSHQTSSLDFLQLLSDLFQTAEKHLEAKRSKLSRGMKLSPGLVSPSEAAPEILALEETIKNSWQTSISLWRAVDQVISYPQQYGVTLSRKHVEYAIITKNLTVVEMLKWAKPEYFDVGENASNTVRQVNWFICGIFGALLGAIGGLLGGLKEGFSLQPSWKKLLFPFYSLLGMLIGGASSAVKAARLGYRSGRFFLTCKLALQTAYMSPFHAPMGSKKQQAVEFKIEQTLFEVSKNQAEMK